MKHFCSRISWRHNSKFTSWKETAIPPIKYMIWKNFLFNTCNGQKVDTMFITTLRKKILDKMLVWKQDSRIKEEADQEAFYVFFYTNQSQAPAMSLKHPSIHALWISSLWCWNLAASLRSHRLPPISYTGAIHPAQKHATPISFTGLFRNREGRSSGTVCSKLINIQV